MQPTSKRKRCLTSSAQLSNKCSPTQASLFYSSGYSSISNLYKKQMQKVFLHSALLFRKPTAPGLLGSSDGKNKLDLTCSSCFSNGHDFTTKILPAELPLLHYFGTHVNIYTHVIIQQQRSKHCWGDQGLLNLSSHCKCLLKWTPAAKVAEINSVITVPSQLSTNIPNTFPCLLFDRSCALLSDNKWVMLTSLWLALTPPYYLQFH